MVVVENLSRSALYEILRPTQTDTNNDITFKFLKSPFFLIPMDSSNFSKSSSPPFSCLHATRKCLVSVFDKSKRKITTPVKNCKTSDGLKIFLHGGKLYRCA